MRSVTSGFAVMVSPNWISLVLLSVALVSRKETLHVHDASEWVSWHSVGHLSRTPYIEPIGYLTSLSDSPCAGATGARECNARNRLYEGRFSGALPSHDGDGGDIKIYVGSSNNMNP